MRTSAEVARSTTSSLLNASAPRVLSRRANSWTLIICSLIVGLLMIHRNPGFGRRFLHPPCGPPRPPAGCQQLRPLRGGPQLFDELVARRGRHGRHALCHPCCPTTPGSREECVGSRAHVTESATSRTVEAKCKA